MSLCCKCHERASEHNAFVANILYVCTITHKKTNTHAHTHTHTNYELAILTGSNPPQNKECDHTCSTCCYCGERIEFFFFHWSVFWDVFGSPHPCDTQKKATGSTSSKRHDGMLFPLQYNAYGYFYAKFMTCRYLLQELNWPR